MTDTPRVTHYADITKHALFYGNPNKDGVYLSTAQARDEADTWISQVERIFTMMNVPDQHRANATILRFNGSALKWISAQEKKWRSI